MLSQLQKAIELSKKTGDRLMIFDQQKPDSVHVVMSLDEYEKMVVGGSQIRGLTEEELIDKINRDIAVWKSEQEIEESDLESRKTGYFEPNFEDRVENNENKANPGTKKNPWSIPSDVKDGAEEIIEEDRQYLEEINF